MLKRNGLICQLEHKLSERIEKHELHSVQENNSTCKEDRLEQKGWRNTHHGNTNQEEAKACTLILGKKRLQCKAGRDDRASYNDERSIV